MKEHTLRPLDVSGATFGMVRSEVVRKSLHFLVAVIPALAAMNRTFTVLLLSSGALVYLHAELFRTSGRSIPLISMITALSQRPRDEGRFVLGPITLALGALVSLFLFDAPTAQLAIWALAFGDGFASLVGRLFGSHRPAFLGGKSLEGSASCFLAVFWVSLLALGDPLQALSVATVATGIEALPLGDWDNVVLPLAVGAFLTAARLAG